MAREVSGNYRKPRWGVEDAGPADFERAATIAVGRSKAEAHRDAAALSSTD